MSLNGLDDPQVKEAHESAVAEAGGWFILKYASRDELELLGRGQGGIVEVRNAIAQYEEPSPLYGFLRYRRRNVIIKYLPEGCSRLIQARVTVHLESICERFTPYDTVFPIASAKELKDTKLSAACSLHTASGSTSSSTSSLRRRRLMEIAEEEEEEQRASKRQSVVAEEADARPKSPDHPPVTLDPGLAASPEESQFSGAADPPTFVGAPPRPPSPAKSLDTYGNRSDLYGAYALSKPKVKLGPRPSLDGNRQRKGSVGGFRPTSALPAGFKMQKKKEKSQGARQSMDESPQPPTARDFFSLSARDENAAHIRPHTSGGVRPPQIPESPITIRPPLTPGANLGNSIRAPLSSAISPEKSRLKKAMQLREKKRQQALLAAADLGTSDAADSILDAGAKEAPVDDSEPPAAPVESPATESDVAVALETADTAKEEGGEGPEDRPPEPTEEAREVEEAIDENLAAENVPTPAEKPQTDDDHLADTQHDGSVGGGQTDPNAAEEPVTVEQVQSSDKNDMAPSTNTPRLVGGDTTHSQLPEGAPSDAHTDPSPPASPLVGPSEVGNSTKASSLSESTGETVLEQPQGKSPKFQPEEAGSSAEASTEPTEPPVDDGTAEQQDAHREEPAETKVAAQGDAKSPSDDTLPIAPTAQLSPPNPQSEGQAPETTTSAAESTAHKSKTHVRKATIDPIRIEPASLSDDEDLMDELQSAVVQEARPINVTKSPITPVFPNHPSAGVASDAGNGSLSPRPITSPGIGGSTMAESSPGQPSGPAIRPMTSALDSPSEAPATGSSSRPVTRAASNPTARAPLTVLVSGDGERPAAARAASSGAAFLNRLAHTSAVPPPSPSAASTSGASLMAKKTSVGNSISQRIKALEKLSSAGGVNPPAPTERPQSTFFAVRHQPSIRDPTRSNSVIERANSISKDHTPSPPRSRGRDIATPNGAIRDRSGSISSRLSMFEGGNLPRGRPDSVQVTARIVRDARHSFQKAPEARTDVADAPPPLDLKHSVLLVDHPKSEVEPPAPAQQEVKDTIIQRRFSKREKKEKKEKRRSMSEDGASIVGEAPEEAEDDGQPRRRSSLSIVRDFIKDRRRTVPGARSPSTDNLNPNPNPALSTSPMASPHGSRSPSRPPSTHHSIGISGRLSISSRRSSMSKDRDVTAVALMSPSNATEGSGSGDEASKTGTEKKSRASRFIRRLSNSLSSTRKVITPVMSPTVAEEENDGSCATFPPAAHQPGQMSYMGDVNVQFPDNLLWKRRSMCLDSQGFLILTAVPGSAAATTASAIGVRRFHLSDFRAPYAPDLEHQELPNSVCLDFVDGSSLQVACEDRAGQLNTLHALQAAHRNHTTFGH